MVVANNVNVLHAHYGICRCAWGRNSGVRWLPSSQFLVHMSQFYVLSSYLYSELSLDPNRSFEYIQNRNSSFGPYMVWPVCATGRTDGGICNDIVLSRHDLQKYYCLRLVPPLGSLRAYRIYMLEPHFPRLSTISA